jgi:ABC-type iron transport system FetAB permease component
LVLLGATVAVLALTNRLILKRLLKAGIVFLGSMLILGGCLSLLCRLDAWWGNGLWSLLTAIVLPFLVLSKCRQSFRRLFVPVLAAVAAGLLVQVACLWLCFYSIFTTPLFLAVLAVSSIQLYGSLPSALGTYLASLRHTREHLLYLQANGATLAESLMPSVRRALRATVLPFANSWVQPLLIVPPMLLGGVLFLSASPAAAVATTVLIMLTGLAGSVISTAVLLFIMGKYKIGM